MQHRPTSAQIDLNCLRHNLNTVKELCKTGTKIMAIVKADAYGHGAVRCSQELEKAGADWLGVATLEEAIELRENNLTLPILCLGGIWPGQQESFISHNITPTISSLEHAVLYNSAALNSGQVLNVHIKVDTGMGRIGIPHKDLNGFLDQLRSLKNIKIEGVMTHFAEADTERGKSFTQDQIKIFDECLPLLANHGHYPTIIDSANSPAIITLNKNVSGNMVRPGGALYGLVNDMLPENSPLPDLKPVMSLVSKIANIKKLPAAHPIGYSRTFYTKRESLIASIPIGYSDGYPRALQNRSSVIIGGEYAPLVGRISMDWALVDVTDIKNVESGSDVILIGEQNGKSVSVFDIAAAAETISYEITCGISKRVPRYFIN